METINNKVTTKVTKAMGISVAKRVFSMMMESTADKATWAPPTMMETTSPNNVVMEELLLPSVISCVALCGKAGFARSRLVENAISTKESASPINSTNIDCHQTSILVASITTTVNKTDIVETIMQNKIFALTICFALTGIVLSIANMLPSRLMFVVQKVFVKMLNIAITKMMIAKLQSITVIVFIIDCIKFAQTYAISGNVTAVAKYWNAYEGVRSTTLNSLRIKVLITLRFLHL